MSTTNAESSSSTHTSFSAEDFFATQPAPPQLGEFGRKAQEFVAKHVQDGRRVVLVTSGGTTVPLEKNVVRFLDNFSAGTRGATSAEYFLAQGYAVIFMHRQHSLQPYTRHYSHTTNPFLDLLQEDPQPSSPARISVEEDQSFHLLPVLRAYHSARSKGTLLQLPFTTVTEYLFMLREMAIAMKPLGRQGMYYLAAAVSDFFIPSTRTSEHKIQSGKGSLLIEMDQVPKVLKPMVERWAPEGFVVSFKLETDEKLLIPKARQALQRYGHQCVIGNELNHRKFEVVFVERKFSKSDLAPVPNGPANDSSTDEFTEAWIRLSEEDKKMNKSRTLAGSARRPSHVFEPHGSRPWRGKFFEKEIEEDIVEQLLKRHDQWIAGGEAHKSNDR
ncbi:phosphopantothenate-cysteine ligase [Tilletiaria anomala UBC 951]|uniref:Phosphopantothenate-cysteine ligase n=1 Tax=Tilletiaria anomala (strain ATCC 24038 / CBS 436.72 / UBC 951) TaxID=1037660 RepID=A0A066W0E0_TILAU|nr:phosphopantothenate-cysteine ligase [Tilletiaria anomala UBC 951]KDN44534.1 phosphopantothenate-cysteine ligase [Tilletiaria anomala UBC 951]